MEFSLYLLVGLLLSLWLAWKPKPLAILVLCVYWLFIFLNALGIYQPFSYQAISWSKQLGITFSWHLDGLATLFSILISGIGILIFIYAGIYSQGNLKKRAKLLSILQVFAISMLGIVLSDNLIVLFLSWELTTVTSYLLIQFDVSDKSANQAAFNGLFISVIGGLAMLAGFILLQQQSGSWSIQVALYSLNNSQHLSAAFWLLLLGAVTKSAQFPFYFWLPGAMKAPTPVSAYLHSATMVNAGIYLLARFHPLFGSLDAWYPSLTFFGMSTMLLAGLLSLCKNDLKSILAYTTLFALGSMVYLLASDLWLAAKAFALFLFFHGLYKAAAFMWVGTIDLSYGTRDITQLRGLGRRWPIASIVAVISLASMAGLPVFFGFAVKEMLYESKLASGSVSYSLMAISMFSSMLIAAASLKCLYYWFVGNTQVSKKKSIAFGLICPLILVAIIFVLEILQPHFDALLNTTASNIIHHAAAAQFNKSFSSTLLSLVTVIGGVILLVISEWLNTSKAVWPNWLNPQSIFEKGLSSILYFGRWFTYITQHKAMSKQLLLILTALILWLVSAFYFSNASLHLQWQHTSIPTTVLSILLIISGLTLLVTDHFLTNMVSLAVFGLVMSGIFVLQGAPDVAMTQLLVEILTVIILVIALRKAFFRKRSLSKKEKTLHSLIAIIVGFIMTIFMFMITGTSFNPYLSQYFIQNSLPLAHGHNVVNVILVDFRAFDTLGEALVIFAVALAVWLLIDKRLISKPMKKENM